MLEWAATKLFDNPLIGYGLHCFIFGCTVKLIGNDPLLHLELKCQADLIVEILQEPKLGHLVGYFGFLLHPYEIPYKIL